MREEKATWKDLVMFTAMVVVIVAMCWFETNFC